MVDVKPRFTYFWISDRFIGHSDRLYLVAAIRKLQKAAVADKNTKLEKRRLI